MKYLLTILTLTFVIFNIYAQPAPLWIQQFNSGGTNSDNVVDTKLDKDGNVYIAGYIRNNDTAQTFLTIKYNTNGDFRWSRTYNCLGGWDEPVGLEVDSEGNVYVAGRSDTINSLNNFMSCFTLIKYSKEGSLLWIKRFVNDDSTSADPKALCIDDSSNLYVTGIVFRNYDYDYATVKYNKNGEFKWSKLYHCAHYNSPLSIYYKNNFIYITGTTDQVYGNTLKYNINGELIWITNFSSLGKKILVDDSNYIYIGGQSYINVYYNIFATSKYDSSGGLLWSKTYKSNNWYMPYAYLKDIAIEKGDVYVTGICASDSSTTGGDYTTIKYNSYGDSIWTRIYKSLYYISHDNAASLISDKCENVYVTGSTDSCTPLNKFTTIKYDSSGSLKWVTKFPVGFGFANYFAQFIRIDTSENIYVIGTNRINEIGYDIFILKYSTTTNISNISSVIPNSSILYQNFPNPFNQTTKIRYQIGSTENIKSKTKNGLIVLKVYNILGKEVATLVDQKQNAGVYEVIFDAENLSTGIYFYRLIANGNILNTKKLILIK